MKTKVEVCIIGGGASGLYAAHTLDTKGFSSYLLVEASISLGGRIHQSPPQSSSSSIAMTEIGAEIIHGDDTLLIRLLKQLNVKYEYSFNLFESASKCGAAFYHHNELIPIDDPIILEMRSVLKKMYEYDSSNADMSVQQFINQLYPNDIKKRDEISKLIDVFLVKTWGSDLDLLSLEEFDDEVNTLEDVNFQFSKGYGYKNVIDYLKRNLRENENLLLNYPVYKIEWSQSKNCFSINDGQVICNHVIVTVPLSILQLHQIEFVPPLPRDKQVAINQCLMMRPAMKIALRFKSKFWKSNIPFGLVFVSDHPIVSQFWFSSPINQMDQFVITAFTTGDRAEYAIKHNWSNNQVIDSFRDLVYSIFGHPSDDVFLGGVVFDWVRDAPFVLGGYSSPTVETTRKESVENSRLVLSDPINFSRKNGANSVLVFAGEATHIHNCATVNGALESGEFAAQHVMNQLQIRSRL
jgi:monoamine oxidase